MFYIQHSLFIRWSLVVVALITETFTLQGEDKQSQQAAVQNDARLVEGASRCSGRLEMKYQGEWRALNILNTRRKNSFWYAQIACKQMGCGSTVLITYSNSDTVQPVWEANFMCTSSDSSLKDCRRPRRQGDVQRENSTYSLQVICSESLRLVGHSEICSGSVEVKSDQGWVSVCEDSFDSGTQELFCRELGCGPPNYVHGLSLTGTPSLLKQFQCQGNESRLEDCVSFMKKECKKAAAITCSEGKDLRLVGGENLCQGTLEGKHTAEWRPLENGWNSLKPEHFAEVCGKMGCGGFISVSRNYYPEPRPVWMTDCDSQSSSFCKSWRGTSSNLVLAVTCEEDAMLVKGPNRCSGKLRVRSGQSWLPVCNYFFSAEAALVTCRDLQCGFPEDNTGISFDMFSENPDCARSLVFNCTGTEKHLRDCPSMAINATEEVLRNCAEVYVTCSELPPDPHINIHTVQASMSKYLPKVFKGHRFAISCVVYSPYSILSIRLKSRYNVQEPIEWIQSPIDKEAVFIFPAAEDAHQGTYQCDYNLNLSPDIFSQPKFITVKVEEMNNVRLVNDETQCAGRLEMEHQGEWRPLGPRHTWSLKEAAVVCRQLDCGSAVSTHKVDQTAELQLVWRFYSDCDGSEHALTDCGTVKKWPSSPTVEVVCSEILLQPNVSFFSVMSKPSADQPRNIMIYKGHSFSFTCSVTPQYPGGHFSLIFNQTHSITQPAVNHSAHFMFPAADEAHQGNYSCVYHNFVFNHNFSSESQRFSIDVEDKLYSVQLDDGVLREDDSEPCAGRLLVSYLNLFLLLSAETTVWDMKHASVVCRQLGCGSAISTKDIKLPKKQLTARFFSDCDGSESALLDCGAVLPWYSSSAVELVCTGHQGGADN